MKSVGEIVRTDPVWVNPNHVIGSAILLMHGHNVCGLPVMEGSTLIGVLRYENLVGVDVHQRVGDVMWYQIATLSSALSLREAADIMVNQGMSCMPVVGRQGELLGLITSMELLSELRRSTDPLTDLPWADSLRDWGIASLRNGKEITILFLDINDFGKFNKQFGHVVGDMVLRAVADGIRRMLHPEREILCRYGGDEFCIASLRGAEEAHMLAETLKRVVRAITLPEIPDETIRVSIGQYGGKRTQEREHIHFAATLNNLINLASRECIALKGEAAVQHSYEVEVTLQSTAPAEEPHAGGESGVAPMEAEEPEPEEASDAVLPDLVRGPLSDVLPETTVKPEERVNLNRLEVTWDQSTANVAVEIAYRRSVEPVEEIPLNGSGGMHYTQRPGIVNWHAVGSMVSRKIEPGGLPTLIAEATLSALQRVLPESTRVRLEEVVSMKTSSGRELLTILVNVASPAGDRSLTGTVVAGEDAAHAVAYAVLHACNSLFAQASSVGSVR